MFLHSLNDRWIVWLTVLTCCMSAIGCSNQLARQYGESDGSSARRSPAGLSILRNLCEANERNTVVVRTLSPRAANKLKGIVWAPHQFYSHRPPTFAWIDRWLSSGDRTLIYIGRDYQPMSDYWNEIAEQKLETDTTEHIVALERSAIEKSELDQMHAGSREFSLLPWCLVQHDVPESRVVRLRGTWADDLELKGAELFLRSRPIGWTPELKKDLETKYGKQQTKLTNSSGNKTVPTLAPPTVSQNFEFEWQPNDEDSWKTLQSIESDNLPQWTPLLETDDGDTLIASITSRKWRNSRVVFVANSSMTCNLKLLNQDGRLIASKIIETLPKDTIGFVANERDPNIRDNDDYEQQKGFEMLTVWPLNVITIHAVFLGALMLIAAFPIFGRAKKLPPKSTQDFGQHVEAVGALLNKSHDRAYARSTIADYFRIVRKEPTSPWAKLDEDQNDPKSPFQSQAHKPS